MKDDDLTESVTASAPKLAAAKLGTATPSGARIAGWTMLGAGTIAVVAGLAVALTAPDHSKALNDAQIEDSTESFSCVLRGHTANYCIATEEDDNLAAAQAAAADKADAKRATIGYVAAGLGGALFVGGVIVLAVRRPEQTVHTEYVSTPSPIVEAALLAKQEPEQTA